MWCKGGPYDSWYHKIMLMHRKGWQKMGEGPLQGEHTLPFGHRTS
jgi:hypothetical protein